MQEHRTGTALSHGLWLAQMVRCCHGRSLLGWQEASCWQSQTRDPTTASRPLTLLGRLPRLSVRFAIAPPSRAKMQPVPDLRCEAERPACRLAWHALSRIPAFMVRRQNPTAQGGRSTRGQGRIFRLRREEQRKKMARLALGDAPGRRCRVGVVRDGALATMTRRVTCRGGRVGAAYIPDAPF